VIEAELQLAHPGFKLDVKLCLPGRGVSVLLGPSGCGKTTVLRAVAGLSRAQGRVAVGDEVWQDDAWGQWLPTHRRPIGMVFQEASLFAHLSVEANLLYGYKRIAPEARKVQPADAIQLLGIGHLLARRPEGLSGGERQRVAIARALLTSPALLLMDEPLSALDAARKAEVLPYLETLGQGGVPIVYVTHALDEAARLADHLVVLREGRVQAEGGIHAVMSRLDTPLSALEDAAAVLQACVVGHVPDQGLSQLALIDGALTVGETTPMLWVGQSPAPVGQRMRVRVLARDVSVSLTQSADSSILNILPAVIDDVRVDGVGSVMLRLRLTEGQHLLARVTQRSAQALALAEGQAVFAQIKGAALLRG